MNINDMLLEYDVILASASPRRKELMQIICSNYRIIPSDCEEILPEDIVPEMAAEYISNAKCRCIAGVYDNSLVIGCDTVVINDGIVLGKPSDKDNAAHMLRSLSGKTHKVITGVTIGKGRHFSSFSTTTEVTFRNLSEEDIQDYIATGEPMDKAGAYGIQGFGSLLVEKINGDFYNVVGLPVSDLAAELKKFLGTLKGIQISS